MGKWVDNQYEPALAFLFITITALLPTSFSIGTADPFGRIITIRWWLGDVVFIESSSELSGWRWVHDTILLQEGTTVFTAYLVWGIAVTLFVGLLMLCLVLFFKKESVTSRLPVTRVTGGSLVIVSLVSVSSLILESVTGFPGIYIPVGSVFMLVFGVILLTNTD